MTLPKIIYIDDQTQLKEALSYFAGEYNAELIQCNSVEEAMPTFKSNINDVSAILFDLDFADENTTGLRDFLRLKAKYPYVPVFLMSSGNFLYNHDLKNEFLRNGATSLFDKTNTKPENIIASVFKYTSANIQQKLTAKKDTDSSPFPENIIYHFDEIKRNQEKYFRVRFGYILASLALPRSLEEESYFKKRLREYYKSIVDVLSTDDYKMFCTHLKIQNIPSTETSTGKNRIVFYFVAEFGNKTYLEQLTRSLIWDLHFFLTSDNDETSEVFGFDSINDLTELLECTEFDKSNHYQLLIPELLQVIPEGEIEPLPFLPKISQSLNDPDLFFKVIQQTPYKVEVDIELRKMNLLPGETDLLKSIINSAYNPTVIGVPKPDQDMVNICREIIENGGTAYCVSVILGVEKNSPNNAIKSAIKHSFYNERTCYFEERSVEKFNRFSLSQDCKTSILPFVYSRRYLSAAFWWPIPVFQPVKGLDVRPLPFNYCPTNLPLDGITLGQKKNLHKTIDIKISDSDLAQHLYLVGQTGTGKSTMLKTIFAALAKKGEAVVVIDPHGDLYQAVLNSIPQDRQKDLIAFDITDIDCPKINLLEFDKKFPEQKEKLLEELFAFMNSKYDMKSNGGPMFESYFKNSLEALYDNKVIEKRGFPVLPDINLFFYDSSFRKSILQLCSNYEVKIFWEGAENTSGDQQLANFAPYITSKFNRLTQNEILRPLACTERKSVIDFDDIISGNKILLVKLDKGKVGNENSCTLGFFILNRIIMASMSQSDISFEKRKRLTLIVDEFQNFTSATIAMALSEVRKYKLQFVLANQTVFQLDKPVLNGILGNAGNRIMFRLGPQDYDTFEPYLVDSFSRKDISSLPNYNCVGQFLINGQQCRPFVFNTIS